MNHSVEGYLTTDAMENLCDRWEAMKARNAELEDQLRGLLYADQVRNHGRVVGFEEPVIQGKNR